MQKPKISCIYLDMDGVIANFEQRYEEWFGNVPEEERRTHFKANFVKELIQNQLLNLSLTRKVMAKVLKTCIVEYQI